MWVSWFVFFHLFFDHVVCCLSLNSLTLNCFINNGACNGNWILWSLGCFLEIVNKVLCVPLDSCNANCFSCWSFSTSLFLAMLVVANLWALVPLFLLRPMHSELLLFLWNNKQTKTKQWKRNDTLNFNLVFWKCWVNLVSIIISIFFFNLLKRKWLRKTHN